MATRIINIVYNVPPEGPKLHRPSSSFFLPKSRPRNLIIHCTQRISDAELASELAREVKRMNTQLVQMEEAMHKSREILFMELCQYLGMPSEAVKRRWRKMGEEEKRVLLKRFVSEWAVNFHPLSARSVEQMVEEYLHHDDDDDDISSASLLFPRLKRMLLGQV